MYFEHIYLVSVHVIVDRYKYMIFGLSEKRYFHIVEQVQQIVIERTQ